MARELDYSRDYWIARSIRAPTIHRYAQKQKHTQKRTFCHLLTLTAHMLGYIEGGPSRE
jgi:hypothetical protein